METVFGQALALWLGNGDEHHTLESDTTGLNVQENLYLNLNKDLSKSDHPLYQRWRTSGSPDVSELLFHNTLAFAKLAEDPQIGLKQ